MALYKLRKSPLNGQVESVVKNWDQTTGCLHIPLLDPENTDYQEYLKWVADGNTADPAD